MPGAVIWISLAIAVPVPAAASATSCSCQSELETLIANVESNYLGYKLGVTESNRAEYEQLRESLRRKAASTPAADCIFVLREFTDWFEDGHLFVVDAPPVDSAATAALARQRERVDRSEAEFRAYLDTNASRLDPIEGIWYDRGLRVAIVRDSARGRDFVAVTLTSDAPAWEPGMVRAEIRRRDAGGYDVVLYADDQSTRHPMEARIFRGALLRMPPVMWGREYPRTQREGGLLDSTNPRAPTFHVIGAGTALFSIPSHDPQVARAALERLVAQHSAEIRQARTMIIDIRGNEGGSSLTTRALAPFYDSAERRPPLLPDERVPVLVASPDHIAQFAQTIEREADPPAWMHELLAGMKARPGSVVPFRAGAARPFRPDTIHDRPLNVAVLIDEGVVSAGEAFVLEAMQSQRVTLFGQNTGGVIDYQSVQMVRLACPDAGLLLGYPTIGAAADLPAGGLNRTGIAPHVRIGDDVGDWIDFVVRYYGGD